MNLGRVSYPTALERQTHWVRAAKPRAYEIFCFESEPVITMGIRAERERDLLRQSLLQVLRVDRGGESTYHGPGQLVIFPSLHLPSWKFSVRDWVALLLDVTSQLLREYDIASHWDESRPGLYTANGKIAAIGLKIKQGWSRHGLALNVNGDIAPFSKIRVCGIQDAAIDQMSNWLPAKKLELSEVAARWEKIFIERLQA